MRKIATLCMVGVVALGAATSHAQDAFVRMITVQGNAKQDIAPDQALLNVTIESTDKDLKQVKAMQDEKLQGLYGIVGEMGIAKKHLKTQHNQIYPEYRYENKQQVFKGYRASLSILMTIEDMQQTGELMQKLVDGGYDRIGNVRYTLKDDQPILDAVRLKALQNAKAKAEAMADTLGESIGRAIEISEGYARHERPQVQMMARGAMMDGMEMAAAPAMAPPEGELTIQANVTVSFELKN